MSNYHLGLVALYANTCPYGPPPEQYRGIYLHAWLESAGFLLRLQQTSRTRP